MKIEKIRIENLNSLYGCHTIDLNDPAYDASNLFLLWGDTGSGKTTILDAITLALYGCTPRLGLVTGTEKCEMMAQGTTHCYAEVVFCVNTGRYLSRWEQNVNRNGNLNSPTHVLSHEIAPGEFEIVTSSKSETGKRIPELIQLSFEQFTKTVMLAQGGFQEFLKADVNKRAEILEKLTNTKIYTALSMAAYDRWKKAKTALEAAQNLLDGVSMMTADEVNALRDEVARLKTQLKDENECCARLQSECNALEQCDKAQLALNKIVEQLSEVNGRLAAFAEDRARLEKAERANGVEAKYAALLDAKKARSDTQKMLDELCQRRPGAEQSCQQAKVSFEQGALSLETAKKALLDAEPLFKQVRELKTQLNAAKEAYSEANKSVKAAEDNQKSVGLAFEKAKKDKTQLIERQNKANEFFAARSVDADLAEELGGIEAHGTALKDASKALSCATDKVEKCKQDWQSNVAVRDQHQKTLKKKEAALQDKSKVCEAASVALVNAKDGHDLEDLKKRKEDQCQLKLQAELIATYEEKRHVLKDGESCPLCGAKEHPFCHGLTPKESEYDSEIHRLSKQIECIERAQKAADEAEKAKNNAEVEYERELSAQKVFQNNVENAQKALDAALSDAADKQQGFDDALKLCQTLVSKYGVSIDHVEAFDQVRRELTKRKNVWEKSINALEEIKQALVESDKLVESCSASLEAADKRVTECRALEADKLRVVEAKQVEIKAVFGERDVDAEERQLKRACDEAERANKEASQAYHRLDSALTALDASIRSKQEDLEARQHDLAQADVVYHQVLSEHGFADESAFLDARMDKKAFNLLKETRDQMDKTQQDLVSRQKQAQETFNAAKAQNHSMRAIDVVKGELNECSANIEQWNQAVGRKIEALDMQAKNDVKFAQISADIANKQLEYQRWDALNNLIGSSKGDVFRKYAQSFTFDILLDRANHYLQDKQLMTRFELIRKTATDMELEFYVHDYSTGLPRSVENLSGGEKFCLCLGLALGLADMASENVQLDSLFIDEGLGSLDDGTLDLALSMLTQLSQENGGRQVGLITHVSRARDAILTRIEVRKLGGGRSELHGAGCTSTRIANSENASSSENEKPARRRSCKAAQDVGSSESENPVKKKRGRPKKSEANADGNT